MMLYIKYSSLYLKNVKTIKNVIISWRKQKPRKNNQPTQCWKCLMYGHGGEHCNRLPACMVCADQHHTNNCPFNKNEKRPAVFSCFNCKKFGKERTDHSANDINCPFRAQYLDIRQRATTRQTRKTTIIQRNIHTAHVPNEPIAHRSVTNSLSHHNVKRSSYADQLKNNHNSDLFNVDELFDIFTSTLDELSKCTTKVQQMYVVMSMVKHAYNLK